MGREAFGSSFLELSGCGSFIHFLDFFRVLRKEHETLNLFDIVKILPTDYSDYGGEVKRWEKDEIAYPDCSSGCAFFTSLSEPHGLDWGVCLNKESPRVGLLTWEHQAGFGCFREEPDEE